MTAQRLATPAPVTARGDDSLTETVIIAASGTKTAAIDLKTARLAGIQIPSAWDTANITLEVSADGESFVPLYNGAGTLVTLTVGGTSRVVQAPFADLLAYRHIKIVSTATQTAARSLILHLVR